MVRTAKEARSEILRLYEQDPTGWHVMMGRDLKGYYDTSVVHNENLWLLKEEMVNPYESVGFALADKVEKKPSSLLPASFGFRPLPGDLLKQQPDRFDDRLAGEIIGSLMRQHPVPLSQLKSPAAVLGPFQRYEKIESAVPSRQDELDARLRMELDRLIVKSHGHLRRMYG